MLVGLNLYAVENVVFCFEILFAILNKGTNAGPGEQFESMNELLVSLTDRDICPLRLEWREETFV